ncbi:hypothetical protein N7491_011229 [Penicillium cf. griseofulvum]|nr:hypothetical protein N7491_011229 [Penicillium cf. griseofulvum]
MDTLVELFHYNSTYRIWICKTCRWAVTPNHMRAAICTEAVKTSSRSVSHRQILNPSMDYRSMMAINTPTNPASISLASPVPSRTIAVRNTLSSPAQKDG